MKVEDVSVVNILFPAGMRSIMYEGEYLRGGGERRVGPVSPCGEMKKVRAEWEGVSLELAKGCTCSSRQTDEQEVRRGGCYIIGIWPAAGGQNGGARRRGVSSRIIQEKTVLALIPPGLTGPPR